MKVERPGAASGAGGSRGPRRTASGDAGEFARALEKVTTKQAPVPVHAVTPLDSVLLVQEVDERTTRRRTARRRAEAMLDTLDRIRVDLLDGAIPRHRLQNLAEICRSDLPLIDDPRLRGVLEDIELRARVELAKWEERDAEAAAEGVDPPRDPEAPLPE